MSSKDKKAGSTASFHQQLGNKPDAEVPDTTELLDDEPVNEFQQQLNEKDEKINQHWERILRMQADHENNQRRVERDIANAHKFALEKFVLELLPVIDNLERAIVSHLSEESGADSLLEGVKLTLKMFNAALEKFGVQQVDPLQDVFNPELHQAVSMETDPNVKSGIVLSVLQKGYLLNNRLIRPALVIVAK